MASIYTRVIDDIDSGGFIFPYHVHSIYQLVSDKKEVREGEIQTDFEDNETEFTGSVSVGVARVTPPNPSLGQGSLNDKSQVDDGSLSAAFGKRNKLGDINDENSSRRSEKSFVFGRDLRNHFADKSLVVSEENSSRLDYVRSFKTKFGSTNRLSFEFENFTEKDFVQVEIEVLGIADNLRRSVYVGNYNFRVYYDVSNQFLEKASTIREEEFGVGDSSVDVSVDQNGVLVEDNRSGSNVRDTIWVCHFTSSETYKNP